MVDAANPCMFVDAGDLGCSGTESPEQLEADGELMTVLEVLRRLGSVSMGIAPTTQQAGQVSSIPFIGLLAPMQAHRVRGGILVGAGDADLCVRMLSNGVPHRAVPITSALCLAVACRTSGTLAALYSAAAEGPIRIAHASGVVMVEADREPGSHPGGPAAVRHASVYRTARRLFQGQVLFNEEDRP
jgi:2-methylaconitate cis-trans-isomerase PrpF